MRTLTLRDNAFLAPKAAGSPTVGAVTFVYTTPGATSHTVPLPTRTASDLILMFVERNQPESVPLTADSNVTLTEIAQLGSSRRGVLLRVVPINTSVTSFVLSWPTSALARSVCVAISNANYSTMTVGTSYLSDSTTAFVTGAATLSYTTTGNELVLYSGGTNAAATWNSDPTADVYLTTSTTETTSMVIRKMTPAAGLTTIDPPDMDRGASGLARQEASFTVVLTS